MSFHADVKGLREARETLQAMRTRAHDLTPAWQELITWWAATNTEQFASRGRRWRTPWAPLRPTTLAQKRRQGFMSDPLARTTRMREELTRRPLGAEHITHDQMDVGTDLPYAKFHQRGAPRAHLPRRPLVNARAVAAEGTAGSVVLTWIVDGVPNIGGHNTKLER